MNRKSRPGHYEESQRGDVEGAIRQSVRSSPQAHGVKNEPALSPGRISGRQHIPGPRGMQAGTPAFDRVGNLATALGLFKTEQIFGVYDSSSSEVSLVTVTNRRLLMLETKTYNTPVLTSVPFSRITSISYVLPSGLSPRESIAVATTVQIKAGYTTYEVACMGKEQAHEVYDLITWELVSR